MVIYICSNKLIFLSQMTHSLGREVLMPEQIKKGIEDTAQCWGRKFILSYTDLWGPAHKFQLEIMYVCLSVRVRERERGGVEKEKENHESCLLMWHITILGVWKRLRCSCHWVFYLYLMNWFISLQPCIFVFSISLIQNPKTGLPITITSHEVARCLWHLSVLRISTDTERMKGVLPTFFNDVPD